MENMAKEISKQDAARRLIDAAIRMLFSGEDSLAIHTISMAGFRILRDLAKLEHTSMHTRVKESMAVSEKKFWEAANRYANFLKHADKDPNDLQYDLDENANDDLLLLSCFYYGDLGNELSPEMWTLINFVLTLHHDFLTSECPYRGLFFRNNIDFSKQPRSEQLKIAQQLLRAAMTN